MVSVGQVCGTRGSSIVSSAADVQWMSVVRGMRGVAEVCEMCMCLSRGSVGGEVWIRGLGFGFTNPVRTGGECWTCGGVGGVGGEWVGGLNQGLQGWSGVVSV